MTILLVFWFIALPLAGVAAARWAASLQLSAGAVAVVLPGLAGWAIAATSMLVLLAGAVVVDGLASVSEPIIVSAMIWPAVAFASSVATGFRKRAHGRGNA